MGRDENYDSKYVPIIINNIDIDDTIAFGK
jgi:hypothetical protein